MPMTWQRMAEKKREEKCQRLWIEFHKSMTTMISQPARKRLRQCTSQHMESPTVSQRSQRIVKDCKSMISSSIWRTSGVKTVPRWPEETLQRQPKSLPKGFNIPSEYWEQIALDRARWCCLIRRGKNDYEAKRICEAEIKHKERRDPHQSSRN